MCGAYDFDSEYVKIEPLKVMGPYDIFCLISMLYLKTLFLFVPILFHRMGNKSNFFTSNFKKLGLLTNGPGCTDTSDKTIMVPSMTKKP